MCFCVGNGLLCSVFGMCRVAMFLVNGNRFYFMCLVFKINYISSGFLIVNWLVAYHCVMCSCARVDTAVLLLVRDGVCCG